MNILEKYMTHLQNLDRSPKTIVGYTADLRQFQKWKGGTRALETLTASDVRAYRDHLVKKNASPNTMMRHLAALASFGQWGCEQAHLFPENPALFIEPVKVAELAPRWLDPSQKRKLVTAVENDLREAKEKYPRLWLLRQRDAVIVYVLLHTGLRVGELCGLNLSDLTLGERKGTLLVRNGKGRKQRQVMLMNETRKQLSEWLAVRPKVGNDALFIGQTGEPIQPRVVQRLVERYAGMAGLEDVTPHSLRHTYARGLLDSGAKLFEVARLMGHSSLDSTARYVQPSEEDLRQVVERMGEETQST